MNGYLMAVVGLAAVVAGPTTELAERLDVAGIAIDDARLTHLAYASEIAGVMLRRRSVLLERELA